MRASVPAVGGGLARLGREHPLASQAKLEIRDRVAVLVARLGVAGDKPVILRLIGQDHAGLKIARLHALRPRHPGGGKEGIAPGQQGRLAHRHRVVHDRKIDCPFPAVIARQCTGKAHRNQAVGARLAAEHRPHGRCVASGVHHGRAGRFGNAVLDCDGHQASNCSATARNTDATCLPFAASG